MSIVTAVHLAGTPDLPLLLDTPERVTSAALLCTGAKIGTAEGWAERRQVVEPQGTPVLVAGSAKRWFGRRQSAIGPPHRPAVRR